MSYSHDTVFCVFVFCFLFCNRIFCLLLVRRSVRVDVIRLADTIIANAFVLRFVCSVNLHICLIRLIQFVLCTCLFFQLFLFVCLFVCCWFIGRFVCLVWDIFFPYTISVNAFVRRLFLLLFLFTCACAVFACKP